MYLDLDDKEYAASQKFKKDHEECAKKYVGAIGGHFGYQLTETSVGTFGSIICNICKKSENITDYDNI